MKFLKAYCWMLFVFNEWPLEPHRRFGWALLIAIWQVVLWFVKLLALPFWPLFILAAMSFSKAYRENVYGGMSRGAKKPNRMEGTFMMTFNK